MKTKDELIAEIRAGKLAIENDGTVEQLNQVLTFIWPQYSRANGGVKYYHKSRIGGWRATYYTTLPTIKATDLLAMMEEKEYPLTLDISQSEVIGSNNSEPLLDAIHSDTEEKPDIERLLDVCHKLINSFNGTSKEVPTSLYMRLVDAVSLFNNYKPEPLVSESQLQEERDSFAIGFAKWIDKGPYFLHGLTTWKSVDVREPIITDNELLELYKKTLNG